MIKSNKIFLFVVIIFLISCSNPEVSSFDDSKINIAAEPWQAESINKKTVEFKIPDGSFNILLEQEYQIAAIVKGKKYYTFGWESKIAPVDLILVWGRLAEDTVDKYISYSQSGRWYYYNYKANCPVTKTYIINHSANNHIIPATKNLRSAIKSIKVNEPVLLKGYLVKIKGKYKGKDYFWNSSFTRSDSGNHSCELFYITNLKIGNKIYR